VKLLFDQNLSHKLVNRLADMFPDSAHVREVGLKEADDHAVWEYAKANGQTIVSKDSDFHQRSFVLALANGISADAASRFHAINPSANGKSEVELVTQQT
jgi:predicted nuclease of predicted toxin-antitoxin system